MFRARIVDETPSFGLNPAGEEIPILSGDVKLEAFSDIKSTLDLEVPGEWFDKVLPFGKELFVERGVDYGDGSVEWIGLGYFRIDDIDQDDAPDGPIKISGTDRISRMMENRTLWAAPPTLPSYPAQTLKVAFDRWINADPHNTGNPNQDGYGMFLFDIVPINWLALNPNSYGTGGAMVEDSTYEWCQNRLSEIGPFTMRFNHKGELDIISTDVTTKPVVYKATPGENLIKWSRGVSRDGVANIVTVSSSDPEYPGVFFVGYNQAPMFGWTTEFGQVVSRYSSPILKTNAAAESAAFTRLSKMAAPSVASSVMVIPNPALEPLDVIEVTPEVGIAQKHYIDSVTIPLSVEREVTIKTFDVVESS
ncbi:hypothetical protein AD006_01195 [Pseudonocardia sp. EC080610-09]|uniref:DUF5047 domain-containing protein n=1 Tax=unclassified Pseudonocardia TaxID=2619320 RepID=UPI0006CB3F2D|nr:MULTISPECIES: DUF5047 domain-containing protein [unclassified Pseudonocardia]ALE74940.1 hypothetical protein FRP1_22005 [Pseudonocardia sp. EC080625-04]ALL74282.1 hypothetical protein AD006_01195 [Pseudonocardia sp. EC080610-09]ALL81305.1 hypothetical protein AD017_09020 [Pseudonocardia sp. EC080619-01]